MTQQGRGVDGKFAPGNRGGPGRKPREIEQELLITLQEAAAGEKWKAICDKAVEQAMKGKPSARKWIADYLIGPPQPKEEPREDALTNILRQLEGLPPRGSDITVQARLVTVSKTESSET